MEFPFGHHNHHHHSNNREESKTYPPQPYPPQPTYGGAYPPPPPSYGGDYPHAPPQLYPPPQIYPPPPPPQVPGVYQISHNTPHNHMESPNYPPPPPPQLPPYEYGSQSHHESGGGSHHYRPHMPGFMEGSLSHHQNVSHASNNNELGLNNLEGYFGNKRSYKVYCKAGGNSYCVGIRDGKVVLTYHDPNDPSQNWYKDEKYSTKVKDEDGYPSFALVSKAIGKAMKHPISGEPVELIPYKPDHLDASILWTESKDLGSGFRTIRNVNNVRMVLDAFNGDKDHGGVHDGTFLSIFKCWKGDNQNQQWKISSC